MTFVLAVVFVLLRLIYVAHGDVTRFISVGSAFASAGHVPRGITVLPGSGYDGQFYYRLALDPADLHRTAFGITLDSASCLQRIAYSVLAWFGAAAQGRFVPYSLIGVNVVALSVMAWLSGLVARDSGRRAIWGLLIVGYFGFLFSLGRDLTEICEACFVVGGLLALRRRRPLVAGTLLAAALLSRETALAVVGAVALVAIVEIARRQRRPGRSDVSWILPGVVYLAWQLVAWEVLAPFPWGRTPEITSPIRSSPWLTPLVTTWFSCLRPTR